ncbi:hypothetical protein E2C01_027564 [Portunus trituberculatus]|uniref:Uncharacterized protein n=1 Tax=Portunus trituberculatus TaxID=210409 RepID=A0A5B7EMB0_PORTR|nr:hypothetical protein [Portunus trituberculatus]
MAWDLFSFSAVCYCGDITRVLGLDLVPSHSFPARHSNSPPNPAFLPTPLPITLPYPQLPPPPSSITRNHQFCSNIPALPVSTPAPERSEAPHSSTPVAPSSQFHLPAITNFVPAPIGLRFQILITLVSKSIHASSIPSRSLQVHSGPINSLHVPSGLLSLRPHRPFPAVFRMRDTGSASPWGAPGSGSHSAAIHHKT